MDVSEILAAQAEKQKSTAVEREIPLEADTGLLTVTDLNPTDPESYNEGLEAYLQSNARDGVQALLNALFALPSTQSPDGPVAKLLPPITQLPRAKPLPKPKPLTKWEKFAKEKGISHRKKEKAVWDEEKQEWINRWGWKGKNKEFEEQWLTEVPTNADIDHDPSKIAKAERRIRVAKNERHMTQNIARAQGESTVAGPSSREQRKNEINRTLATSRVSTASMGRFDKVLEGEKKLKGVKRKFEPAEVPVEREKAANLALIQKMEKEPRQKKVKKAAGDDILNVRKAIRATSRGKGSVALAKSSGGGKAKALDRHK
ncbi:RRS1-domain-containing protein [Thelephora ganbajun]|uniref:RRS1-domain-containing protein n=1 Tax=Thelephora ganbajun TaxID=370292 RepID=A0ACB6ZQT2_THEGA|nr:RRS1-domain-containing protein [Thelephora ganbajun]